MGATEAENLRRNELLGTVAQTAAQKQTTDQGLMSGVIREAGERANLKTQGSQAQAQRMFDYLKMGLVDIPTAVGSFMPG